MNQSDRPKTTCGQVRRMAWVAPMSLPYAVAHLTGGEQDTQGHFCLPSSGPCLFVICPKAKIPGRGAVGGINHGSVSSVRQGSPGSLGPSA